MVIFSVKVNIQLQERFYCLRIKIFSCQHSNVLKICFIYFFKCAHFSRYLKGVEMMISLCQSASNCLFGTRKSGRFGCKHINTRMNII